MDTSRPASAVIVIYFEVYEMQVAVAAVGYALAMNTTAGLKSADSAREYVLLYE